ncbi:hypothetical protein KAW38_05140 [Candidatus Micrarchaeota archaeon]|nr:hypothetical protein [Candidatus Micrarchaeota archaeon]
MVPADKMEYYTEIGKRGLQPKAEDYAKTIKETANFIADTVIPFYWVPETLEGIKNSENKTELGINMGMLAALGIVDAVSVSGMAASGFTLAPEIVVARKAGYKGIKEISKYLIKKSRNTKAAKELLKSSIKMEKDIAKRGLENAPGKVDEIFSALMEGTKKSRIKNTDELADAAKEMFVYKDKSQLFKALNQEAGVDVKDVKERIKKTMVSVDFQKGIRTTFITVDKGRTWFLNNISRELGDIGLFVYLGAAERAAKKVGGSAVRTGGDEIVITFIGHEKKAAERFGTELYKNIDKVFESTERSVTKLPKKWKDVKNSLKKFSLSAEEGLIVERGGKLGVVSIKGKPGEIVKPMSKFLSWGETRGLFSSIKKKLGEHKGEEILKVLRKFVRLDGKAIKELPSGIKPDGFVGFRLGFDDYTTACFKVAAETEGKAVGQTLVKNGVGPSMMNLLGHPATDFFNDKYATALKNAFEEIYPGIKVTIYQEKPFSLAYKIAKGNRVDISKVVRRTDELFSESVKGAGVSPSGMKVFFGRTGESVGEKVVDFAASGILRGRRTGILQEAIANIHLYGGTFITEDMFKGVKRFGGKEKIVKALRNTPAWARQPEDFVIYLNNCGFQKKEVSLVLDVMEVLFR